MELLGIMIILALFAAQVLYTVRKAGERLADDKSLSAKVCTGVAFGVCGCLVICNSLHIVSPNVWQPRSLNGGHFTIASIGGLVFVWWVFMVWLGGMLAACQCLVLFGVHFNESRQHRRGWLPPGSNVACFTSINAMGIAVAYNLMLYTFGMADWLIIELFT